MKYEVYPRMPKIYNKALCLPVACSLHLLKVVQHKEKCVSVLVFSAGHNFKKISERKNWTGMHFHSFVLGVSKYMYHTLQD